MKNTQFSAKCRYCITIHHGALSRAALGASKAFLFVMLSLKDTFSVTIFYIE